MTVVYVFVKRIVQVPVIIEDSAWTTRWGISIRIDRGLASPHFGTILDKVYTIVTFSIVERL